MRYNIENTMCELDSLENIIINVSSVDSVFNNCLGS